MMRNLIFFLLTILFIMSCNKHDKLSTEDFLERQTLKSTFQEWQKNEIINKHIWAKDSCYSGWFVSHEFNGTIDDMWGFPDSTGFTYSYADVNKDGRLDQLVTFVPSQCDGGNASMWSQIEVLTVSEKDKYQTTALLGDGIFSSLGQDSTGFFFYDSIGVNKIYATYYNFAQEDGHCCPSTIKNVVLDYKTKKVIYTGPNVANEMNQ